MEREEPASALREKAPPAASGARWSWRRLVAGAALLIVGCSSCTKRRADFAGLVDIGAGRKMYLECAGNGFPTVVLVSGLRAAADAWSTPDSKKPAPTVFPEVSKFTRVCAYDRPGTPVGGERPSRSDPVSQPTTTLEAVTDLHALLSAAKEPRPYVFVGHSYGGLVARLYASTYPRDVSGLVLVDALSEELQTRLTAEQWTVFKRVNAPAQEDLDLYKDIEKLDFGRSFEQVRAAAPLRPLPLVVLSADRPWGPQVPSLIAAGKLPPGSPADFGYVIDSVQKAAQENLATLVPNAKHVTNTNSGHDIQIEQPQVVIDAIRDVLDTVRKRPPPPSG